MKKLVFAITCFLAVPLVFSQDIQLAQDTRLVVSDIQAKSLSSREILVSWLLPRLPEDADPSRLSLLLFRSELQLAGSNSLDGLTPIATLPYGATSYTDFPEKGAAFYYTVVIAEAGNARQSLVIPDRNTTVIGAALLPADPSAREASQEAGRAAAPNPSTGLRNTPLPYLRLPLRRSSGGEIPVNPERRRAEGDPEKGRNLPQPHIFRQEQAAQSVGEDLILQEIISGQFMAEKYDLAETSLREFLSIHHSQEAIDRGTFYLGEALLYQGKYRQALSCFLAVQDRYPDLAARWIQAALEGYRIPATE